MALLWSLLMSSTVASILSCMAFGSDMFFAASANFVEAFGESEEEFEKRLRRIVWP